MVLSSAHTFQNQFVVVFFKSFGNISRVSVWIQIMIDVLSGLILVEIVCKGYQQTALMIK